MIPLQVIDIKIGMTSRNNNSIRFMEVLEAFERLLILCKLKRFPSQTGNLSPAQAGSVFAFQLGWVATLGEGLCKDLLQKGSSKFAGQ